MSFPGFDKEILIVISVLYVLRFVTSSIAESLSVNKYW